MPTFWSALYSTFLGLLQYIKTLYHISSLPALDILSVHQGLSWWIWCPFGSVAFKILRAFPVQTFSFCNIGWCYSIQIRIPELIVKDTGKAKICDAFFTLFCSGKVSFQEFQIHETCEKVWNKQELPLMEEGQVGKSVNRLDILTAMATGYA